MKRSMSKTIDSIYQLVKREKIVDVVKFCDMLDMSPSSFYNYKKFVLARYENIIYEGNCFKWIDSEEVVQPT